MQDTFEFASVVNGGLEVGSVVAFANFFVRAFFTVVSRAVRAEKPSRKCTEPVTVIAGGALDIVCARFPAACADGRKSRERFWPRSRDRES